MLALSLVPSVAVQNRIEELANTFAGMKLIVGVDRVDYIKGMPHKLLAIELLLRKHPEWRNKVVLVQVGVPSRSGVPEYQKLSAQVNELVGRINGVYVPWHSLDTPGAGISCHVPSRIPGHNTSAIELSCSLVSIVLFSRSHAAYIHAATAR